MTGADLTAFLGPLRRRVAMMVGRAVIVAVNEAARAQELQVTLLADETHDGVERFGSYGLTSVPHPGAEAVVVAVGGLRSHAIAIAVEDRRYRLAGLQDGEVALYDDLGQVVHLARDGIRVASPTKVTVDAPAIALGLGGAAVARVGDPVVNGRIAAGSAVVSAA